MRRSLLSTSTVSLAVVLALASASCSSTTAEPGGQASGSGTSAKVVTVAISNDAPFAYKDSAGNLTGIDGEMMLWIAKEKNWKVEVFTTDFATLIPSILKKKADIAADAMFITDERKKVVSFTDQWYTQGEGMIVPSNSSITTREQAAGKVIGVQTGTVYDQLAKSLKPKNIRYFNAQAELLKAVHNEQVDVVFTDAAVVAWSLVQNPDPKIKIVKPYKPYFPGTIGAALRKDDTEFQKEMNSGLADLKKSPEYLKILKKYGLGEANAAK